LVKERIAEPKKIKPEKKKDEKPLKKKDEDCCVQ
jgi:hypothetical protein